MLIRERIEEFEIKYLHPKASKSRFTKGRLRPEEPCSIRTEFQRDRDRIIHSKAFRRLKHKTQVFLSPTGDHYRTRLTHTLEVAQIARTIARALMLNEDLTEAIALGHDLGHTPFGHSGEEVLDKILKEKGLEGFRHEQQSLRVVDLLEKEGRGLNLTQEVRDGILKHSKGVKGEILLVPHENLPFTLEGQVVRICDVIAYVNHDLDDALRAGLIKDVPEKFKRQLGERHSQRINTLVLDVIEATMEENYARIWMRPERYQLLMELREFLNQEVYQHPEKKREFAKAEKILRDLFEFFLMDCKRGGSFCKRFIMDRDEPLERRIADFIAGMTDRFAIYLYSEIFIPKPWEKV